MTVLPGFKVPANTANPAATEGPRPAALGVNRIAVWVPGPHRLRELLADNPARLFSS